MWAFPGGRRIKIWAAARLWDGPKLVQEKVKDAVEKLKEERKKVESARIKDKVKSLRNATVIRSRDVGMHGGGKNCLSS